MTISLIVSLVLAGTIIAAVLARRKVQAALSTDGITGPVLYTDAAGKAKTLVSPRHGLVGKPDYVIEEDGALIPVEKKTRVLGRGKPFKGEMLQLAAYCLILEDTSGQRIQLGRLQYDDRTEDIPFDPALRDSLTQVLGDMRDAEASVGEPARNHDSPAKCGSCEFSASCKDSLAKNVARFG